MNALRDMSDEEWDDWENSDEFNSIADMGEHYYLTSTKAPHISDESCNCTWSEGSKEYVAWYRGYRRWGN